MALTRIRADQISNIDYKQAVRVVTTSNITLSGGAPNTVDSVNLAARDRVLVTGQTTASQNGIYVVQTVGTGSNGTWVRSGDANQTGEMEAGMIVMVTEGTVHADTQWTLITNDPIVIGVTELTFLQNIASNGNLAFGTSSVRVLPSGNVLVSVAGTANVSTFTNSGLTVAGNLDIGNNVVVTGNLTVNGTTTTINSNTITTNDKVITLANNQSTGANVNGAGIEAGSPAVATFLYNNATASWQSNVGLYPAANNSLSLGGPDNLWFNVAANTVSALTISAVGNVTGNYLVGNVVGATTFSSNTAPSSPAQGDVWIDLASGRQYVWFNDGTSSQWAEMEASQSFTTNLSGGVAGANTQIQYNNDGSAGASANLTFNSATNVLSVTGNISGTYILGNGSQLTGLPSSYSDSNVTTLLSTLGSNVISSTGNITTTANISAGYLLGNGSQITGLPPGYSNADVATYLASGTNASNIITSGNITGSNIGTSGQISATGNITGNVYFGNGSQLTGVASRAFATGMSLVFGG